MTARPIIGQYPGESLRSYDHDYEISECVAFFSYIYIGYIYIGDIYVYVSLSLSLSLSLSARLCRVTAVPPKTPYRFEKAAVIVRALLAATALFFAAFHGSLKLTESSRAPRRSPP